MARLTDDRIVQLLQAQDLQTLVREAEAHRRAYPHEMLGHYVVGRAQFMMGDDASAQANLTRAIELEESDRPYFWRALSRQHTGDDAGAAADLQRALQLNPAAPHYGYELGRLFARLGEASRARAVLEQTVQANPDYAPALYTLGNVLADLGEAEDAAGAWRRVVELVPNHADAQYNLGVSHQRRGELDLALSHFVAAANEQPDSQVLSKVVQVHYQLGRYGQAESWWARTVEACRAEGKEKFCFDQFRHQGDEFMAYRILDDPSEPPYEVVFYLVRGGEIVRRINLEFSQYGRETGTTQYIVGEDLPDGHITYQHGWNEWPAYDDLKRAVIAACNGQLATGATSRRG